ncbi:thioesterase II family protein [Streptomyces sp. MNP-20]|uniref:thioesterase II family protein n=1 Tax=Streptomyces sp. MNP-20 TaxID=2721165 RepID=UPI00155439C7|nr:alpha/beta fold hydrolase [Streptomyces sp. MNP-20]
MLCDNHALADRWFRRITKPGGSPRARLICFPHAGGTASYFRGWARLVPPDIEVLAVRYPGREDRLVDPFAQSMEALADEVTSAVGALLDRPTAFFGHSMGASVAYEVAARLHARRTPSRAPGPVALFLSGRAGPGHERVRNLGEADDRELMDEVIGMGGTEAAAFSDPELRDLVLPVIRSDFQLVERYGRSSPGSRFLDVPVFAYYGDHDAHLDPSAIEAWSAVTSGPFAARSFDGGHFYLAPHAEELVGDVVGRLRPLLVRPVR